MKKSPGTILAILFFSLFVIYGVFEIGKVLLGPSLSVANPVDESTVSDPLVTVSGTVKRVAYITIDDRQIFADQEGHFSDSLLLLPGYNIISIKVKDRFGKEISKELHIAYAPRN